MSEFDDELRRRHSLVEETAGGMLDLFDKMSPEDHEAFGARVALFSEYAGNIIMPTVCNGVVSLPKEYRDTEALPVLMLEPGETVQLSGDFFPTPRQWHGMCGILGVDYSLDMLDATGCVSNAANALERLLDDEEALNGFFESHEVGLGNSLGKVTARFLGGLSLNNNDTSLFFLYSRPLMLLSSQSTSTFVHELEHVRQRAGSAIFWDEAPQTLREGIFARELRAYHFGALAAHARARLGYELIANDEGNMQIDNLRMRYASSPTDFSVRNRAIRREFRARNYDV